MQARYDRILGHFQAWDQVSGANRTAAVLRCRTLAWFVRHRGTHEVRVHSSRCHVRWCPLCMNSDRFLISRAVLAKLRTLNRVRFMTLTLKHSSAPIAGQLQHLYDSFRRLRRHRWFKDHVRGGVWFFQIKWCEDSESWHPHLHILFDGRYTPQKELSNRWRVASGGSYVVDVRGVKANAKAADYVARYATEPGDIADLETEQAVGLMEALRGRQVKGKWGSMADIVFKPTRSEDADQWERLGPFGNIMFHRSDNQFYADIVSAWMTRSPCLVHPSLVREGVPPPWPDRIEPPETYRQGYLFSPAR